MQLSVADYLFVSIPEQKLYICAGGQTQRVIPVSTARNGAGERYGSECTPRGRHQIRARIGEGLPAGAILKGRRWTGEIWNPVMASGFPDHDWILSRILWLSGCEPGLNRLGEVDTFRRYIYLHGTPDTEPMGIPLSHGCIRLRNADIIDLFSIVPLHCRVDISEYPFHMQSLRG